MNNIYTKLLYVAALATLINVGGYAQKELKFNASSLYNQMIDGGVEYIRKDVGYEVSLRGANTPTLEKRTTGTDTLATNRFGFGVRFNFYKRKDKGISGRYASIFTNYNTKTIKRLRADEVTNVLCVGVACGKKWLLYNRLGFQVDLGVGYDIMNNKPITDSNDWIPKTIGKNDTDISFLYNVQLPLRMAIVVRL